MVRIFNSLKYKLLNIFKVKYYTVRVHFKYDGKYFIQFEFYNNSAKNRGIVLKTLKNNYNINNENQKLYLTIEQFLYCYIYLYEKNYNELHLKFDILTLFKKGDMVNIMNDILNIEKIDNIYHINIFIYYMLINDSCLLYDKNILELLNKGNFSKNIKNLIELKNKFF